METLFIDLKFSNLIETFIAIKVPLNIDLNMSLKFLLYSHYYAVQNVFIFSYYLLNSFIHLILLSMAI